jgi:N-methylhydantoinase A/oxoprolinase/acetone carboxylase beta subunit
MSEEAIGVAKWLVGIDTGGTFTDLRSDERRGLKRRKSSSPKAYAIRRRHDRAWHDSRHQRAARIEVIL